MDNKQVRRKNVEQLVREHGGSTAFGKAVDRDQVQVSQWLGGKPIGDRLARHIEARLGHGKGWLDQPHWSSVAEPEPAPWGDSQAARMDPDMVVVTTRALLVFLRRRDPTATLDLTQPADAELFSTVYAEAAAMMDSPDSDLQLGAVVADLLQAREARKHGRGEGKSAGGDARGKARRKATG